MEKIPGDVVPHNYISLQLAMDYYFLKQNEKGKALLEKIADSAIEYVTWINSLDNNKKRSVQRDYYYNERALAEQVIPMFYLFGDEESGKKYLEKAALAGVDINRYFKIDTSKTN